MVEKDKTKLSLRSLCLRAVLLAVLMGMANGKLSAQVAKNISLKVENAPMATVLTKIEDQSGYKISFTYDEVQKYRVTVNVKNQPVNNVMALVLKGTPMEFTMKGRFITVFVGKQGGSSRVSDASTPSGTRKRVTGQVLDEEGEPVIGATVYAANNRGEGTVTDANGNFDLYVSSDEKQVFISSLGMTTYRLDLAKGTTNRKINMQSSSEQLANVVVTGMYNRTAESFTGSSTTFTNKQLKQVGNTNVLQSLKTLDPSFAIMENTTMGSDPNQKLNIEIRGKTNVAGLTEEYENDPNQPLFILDGFESDLNTISDLSMDRVQSITVLKDAAATAIYGSKAANGVVVVETKAPEAGTLKVNYNGNMNLTWADLSDYNLMNAREKIEFELLSGVYESVNAEDGHLGSIDQERLYNQRMAEVARGVDTYWLSEPLRFAVSHRHNLFIEGGDKIFRYGVGVNYGKTEGVMKGSDRDLINGNVKLIYRKGRFSFTNNLNINYTKAAHESVAFSKFAQANPYYRKYDENGELLKLLESYTYINSSWQRVTENFYSPLYNWSNNNYNISKETGFTNNFEIDWRAIDELRVRTKIGITKSNSQTTKFLSPFNVEYIGKADDEKGQYTEMNRNNWNYDADLSVTYGKLLAKYHQVNAIAGARATQSTYDLSQYAMKGFISDKFTNPKFAQAYDTTQRDYQDVKRRTASFYVNGSYAFDGRYLLDLSWRKDGASVFGTNKHFTDTWSVGLGWNLHNELFMKNVKLINLLKLRASIGNPGNQNFSDYISTKIYTYNTHHTNPWGVSTIISNFGNENLKWQKTLDKNLGFDLIMLKNRLRLNFDIFSKSTDPLLVYMTLPLSAGDSQIPTNVGGLLTTGYTIQANYQIIRKQDIIWSVNGNLRHLHSEYQDIDKSLEQFNEANKSKNMTRYYDGGSPSDLWAVRSAGIDPVTGREIFIRKDGTQTFTHSYDDEVVVGNSEPDFEGVFGTSLYWKGFSASINMRYRLGGQVFMSALYNKVENITPVSAHLNQDKRAFYDRWKNPGDEAKFKAISRTDTTPMSSRFVQDYNILSGESISLGYETEAHWLKAIGASSMTLRAYMNDIFRISTVKQERGIDYPFARSVSFSLGLRF